MLSNEIRGFDKIANVDAAWCIKVTSEGLVLCRTNQTFIIPYIQAYQDLLGNKDVLLISNIFVL